MQLGHVQLRRRISATVIASVIAVPVIVAAAPPAVMAAPRFACATTPAYTVGAGDSWFAIARSAAVPAAELLAANSATTEATLTPGDVLCLPAGASTSTSAGAGACGASYTVARGDGWYAIASRAGVTGTALLAANDATAETALAPGDVLCLPAGASAPATAAAASTGGIAGSYTVVNGDSWFAIASRSGVSTRGLLEANDASASTLLVAGDVITLPPGASVPASGSGTTSNSGAAGSYKVRKGDSWFAIAERAGVTGGALLQANDASRDTVLVPGQTVSLPSGADTKKLASGSSGGWVTLDVPPTQGPCGYGDTWMAPRDGGRRHEGVDIFTVRGQYVYAVTDGRLTSRTWDQPGKRSGNAWWLTASDGRGTFFYAHLLDFAPDLKVGSRVRAGQIIGFVGDTGNAGAVHLHFEVHPGGGNPVNPYPIVKAAGGCNQGTALEQPGGWTPAPVT